MGQQRLLALGTLLADRTRVEILTTLMDGRALTSGELARTVGVAPSTASDHLGRLLDAGLVTARTRGRFRHFQLANSDVAALLEALGSEPIVLTAPRPRASTSRRSGQGAVRWCARASIGPNVATTSVARSVPRC